MSLTRPVLLERGLLKVVAQKEAGVAEVTGMDAYSAYDVVIDGQEVLHTFSTYGEALQFLDMLAPEIPETDSSIPEDKDQRSGKKS